MSLNTLAENQSGWFTDWYVFRQPLGALIFFIAATAEANRTPFDLTEADFEIVAGFATEYSGMRFGFFFFAEYVNVFIISALMVTLYFGGWNAPFPVPPGRHARPRPGSLGIGLLRSSSRHAPVVLTLLFARRSGCVDNRAGVAGASPRLPPCSPLFDRPRVRDRLRRARVGRRPPVVHGQTSFLFVFLFVWMRGTLPRSGSTS